MQRSMKIISLMALTLVVAPSLLYVVGASGLETAKWTALVGTVGWFLSAPMWMSRKLSVDAKGVES